MSVLKPRSLRPGDTVMMVSPASPVSADGISATINILESAGYNVRLGAHALDTEGYLAGSDVDRASDLMVAFEAADVNAVLCSRGGYGCARLIPHLDFDRMAASRKMFVGFSDVTSLHLALNRRGLCTFYAPMALTLGFERKEWVFESWLKCLRGEDPLSVPYPPANTLVAGKAIGRTVGGCLCLLTDSIGTENSLEAEGKILLIEDVDEAPHRIDAMLTHLLNAGILQRAAGIVVGEMTRTEDSVDQSIGASPWREIFTDRVGRLGIPTVVDFPMGHMKNMLSLPLGVTVN